MKYIGNGRFLPGVPARDLTAAEVKQHGKQFLLDSKLYVEEKKSKGSSKAPKNED